MVGQGVVSEVSFSSRSLAVLDLDSVLHGLLTPPATRLPHWSPSLHTPPHPSYPLRTAHSARLSPISSLTRTASTLWASLSSLKP